MKIVCILLCFLVIVKIVYNNLIYLQESHYHISSFKKIVYNFYVKEKESLFLSLMIPLIFINGKTKDILYILLALLYLGIYKKKIIKLKPTKRIIRLMIFIFIVNILFGIFLRYEVLSFFEIFVIFISFLLSLPVEGIVFLYYKNKCIKKLKRINPIKIAITGSFGKTSTKVILYEILKRDYLAFKTPKSYNTLNGICKCVNEEMDENCNLAIFEFGASRKGDIKKLCKLVKPDYSIITEIGPQHLETFGSIDNIIEEKMSLVSFTKNEAVLNIDNKYIRENDFLGKNVITVSLGKNGDFLAENIVCNRLGLSFRIISNNEIYEIKSQLLGRHHVYNILLSVALASFLGVKKEAIMMTISSIFGEENRLKLKEFDGELILDDSFNSNVVGFRNALEVLGMYDKYRVLLTPGIVELKDEEEKVNYDLANLIKNVADEVILVKNKASSHIYKGLVDLGYKNVRIVEGFKEGFLLYKNINKNKILLIENDISDIYKI